MYYWQGNSVLIRFGLGPEMEMIVSSHEQWIFSAIQAMWYEDHLARCAAAAPPKFTELLRKAHQLQK